MARQCGESVAGVLADGLRADSYPALVLLEEDRIDYARPSTFGATLAIAASRLSCGTHGATQRPVRHAGASGAVGDEDVADVLISSMPPMKLVRSVVVFDAADLASESAFWAGMLGGQVFEDERWHTVLDAEGKWRIGVQLAPNLVSPEWPDGNPQQVHLDLHVEDQRSAHDQAMALGARLLQPAPDLDSDEGPQVYADPAGHPFCIGWGQPSAEALAAFVAERSAAQHRG